MATARTSPIDPPSAEQLAAERSKRFHQNGNALLTMESVRTWIAATGLALYLPRPDQLAAPAPSFIEAILGVRIAEPTQDQLQQANGMLARLIAEGTCVPLSLLGGTGGNGTDTPDYICSPVVFSFLFTLRGNKAWKTAPMTSGPVKVSQLALNAYEVLAEKVTVSSYDLTTQLGKEVTEAAVLRALTELWQQLRVLPVPQTNGLATLWEPSTSRFTKQIKAGANAGQPTALSALISLYLNQVIAAAEEDVETYLSPLAPRSRLRSVLHDLIGARHLETIVVNGKTLVHVAGDLPSFADNKRNLNLPRADTQGAENLVSESGVVEGAEDSRIRKFTPNPAARLATGLRARPAFGSKPAFTRKPGFGGKPAYGRPTSDRERPSFNRPARPSFRKPWDEDRNNRRGAEGVSGSAGEIVGSAEQSQTPVRPASRPQRSFSTKPTFSPRAGSARPEFRDKPAYGDRSERPRRDFGSGAARLPRPDTTAARPSRPFSGTADFSSRGGGEKQNDTVLPRTFSKPGTFGRKRESGFDRSSSRPPRRDFSSTDTRPPRREFNSGDGRPPRREFNPERQARSGFTRPGNFSGPRPERSSGGSREGFSGIRPDRAGNFPPRPPFAPQSGNERPAFRERPAFGGKSTFGNNPGTGQNTGSHRPEAAGSASERPRQTFRKFDAPRGPKPFGSKRPFEGSRSSVGASNTRSSFAAKGGPFAKFADGKKPFRKPGKPAGGGGFAPTRRKRPEDEVK